ncbi:hypothetical protein CYMTET_18300, partial [Cymbomonas tetramitiformis]
MFTARNCALPFRNECHDIPERGTPNASRCRLLPCEKRATGPAFPAPKRRLVPNAPRLKEVNFRERQCANLAAVSEVGQDASMRDESSFFTDSDTIIAIATPDVPQAGGVAIVRLSGPDAVRIVTEVFRPAGKTSRTWTPTSHTAQYGNLYDAEDTVFDEVLVLPFLAPRSYTREDVVEIHTHGGGICSHRTLARCIELGARPAQPGEFTLRAFLAGRIDLAQAEAVEQLIAARTHTAADGALAGLRGEGPSAAAKAARAQCILLLAEVEARLDFEDDLPPLDHEEVLRGIAELERVLQGALNDAKRATVAHTGLTVALVGRPNVGKSSLLNSWTRSERAIVTAVP